MSRLLDLIKNSKCENRKEIIAEAEKYEWHDLRENPNDLPKEPSNADNLYKEYLVKFGRGYYIAMFYGEDFVTDMMNIGRYEAVAWKEIEPFKE